MSKLSRKILVGILFFGLLAGVSIYRYVYTMKARDVQSEQTDFTLSSSSIVNEYLANPSKANEKYLSEDGDSKILSVSGVVFSKSKDQNSQFVVLLKDSVSKAGVSCTFTAETNHNAEVLAIGEQVLIKGVIRSGAGYDPDLELYEDVIMEKCDLINR